MNILYYLYFLLKHFTFKIHILFYRPNLRFFFSVYIFVARLTCRLCSAAPIRCASIQFDSVSGGRFGVFWQLCKYYKI